jgi:hypothetical protein
LPLATTLARSVLSAAKCPPPAAAHLQGPLGFGAVHQRGPWLTPLAAEACEVRRSHMSLSCQFLAAACAPIASVAKGCRRRQAWAKFGNDVVEGKWLDVWPLTDILLTMAMPIPLGLGCVG